MKKTLLAVSAIAALAVVSAGTASAQDVRDDPGYISPDHERGFREERRGDNCHLVITHRRSPEGSVTVRRRVCD